MNRVFREILQGVAPPAHVPLEIEPQAPGCYGTAHEGPRRRFLRDHHKARMTRVDSLVDLPEQRDGFQVLAASVLVGNPLSLVAAVIQIEHGGDGIDAQPVDVILLGPEERVGQQEVAYLVAPVVEDVGSPTWMLALARG